MMAPMQKPKVRSTTSWLSVAGPPGWERRLSRGTSLCQQLAAPLLPRLACATSAARPPVCTLCATERACPLRAQAGNPSAVSLSHFAAAILLQASLRQRNRPRPARFAAVFGAMAVSVALYQGVTQQSSFGEDHTALRRRLATACKEQILPRTHKTLTANTPGEDKEYKCGIDELGDLFGQLATKESCLVDCPAANNGGIGQCAIAANKAALLLVPGYGDLPDGKDFPVGYDIAKMIDSKNKKNADKIKCEAASGVYTPATINCNTETVDEFVVRYSALFGPTVGTCSVGSATTEAGCITASGTWTAKDPDGVTSWRTGVCNLFTETNRESPGEEVGAQAAALYTELAAWETHDDVSNAPKGELDSSDFNKALTKPIFQWGSFLLYAFCTFYLFCGIAIVCDDFFTASLETLSIKFDLSEDVAGATFMAAGSSAPELFTSLSAVIIKDECANRSSVGIGTIVGSAIFNILVIIGATCMLAGQVLQLGWKPMIRDSCWYALSIALLIIFVMPETVPDLKAAMGEAGCVSLEEKAKASGVGTVCTKLSRPQYVEFEHDGEMVTSSTGLVTWWEGLIMWLAYIGYIAFMHFNEAILGETGDKITDEDPEDRVRRKSVAGEEEGEDAEKKDTEAGNTTTADGADAEKAGGDDEDEDDEVDCLGVPKPEELGDKVFTYFSYPWYLVFMLTIPDCESDKWKDWYAVSFGMSIVWIGLICYGMVEFCILIGLMCDISSTVMGLTVLSAGTSVPDAISSIVVAQRGLGDMAISNALGSNVFDILLGLGFPYFLSAIKEDQPVMMCVDDVGVYLACLVIVLFLVVGTFSAFKFALRPTMGIILICIYVLFFLMAVLRDQGALPFLGMACDAGH